MDERELLAWHQYPGPGGQSYYDSDLDRPDKVQRLFDLCQILEAYVTAGGWRFLMSEYGVSGLLEINRGSGWFDEEDDAEATEEMRYHCFTSGYNPDTDEFGRYDEETGLFHPTE